VVNGDAGLQARHRRMVFAEPFLADLERASDRCFVIQKRVQIAAFAKVDDLLSVPLNPVRLRREDECPLALRRKLPGREQGQM